MLSFERHRSRDETVVDRHRGVFRKDAVAAQYRGSASVVCSRIHFNATSRLARSTVSSFLKNHRTNPASIILSSTVEW